MKLDLTQAADRKTALVPLGSLMETRDQALQLESEGAIDIAQATFRVVRHDRHPMGRWCDLVAPNAVRPDKAPVVIPGPMPKYGADTRAVLQSLGFTSAEIEAMIASGAAGTSWSERYLPE